MNTLKDIAFGKISLFQDVPKGIEYNLSTSLNQYTWYTISLTGNFQYDDLIGVWIGNKFVGYLNTNDYLTFRSDFELSETTITLKSRSTEGRIETLMLNEGREPLDWEEAFEDWSFPVPLGIFIVDEDERFEDVVNLKAMDNMLKLGGDYSKSNLSYPATLLQIYENICSDNNIIPGTTNFPNRNYVVKNRPDGDYSYRDILGYVAELSGTFAKFNRSGHLELKWYEDYGLEIDPDVRYNLKLSDEEIQITGVQFVVEGSDEEDDVVYLTGTDEYVIDISENPLFQDKYEEVLPNILANIEGVKFRPYESDWFGDPTIESGDMVVHETVDGEIVNSIITNTEFNYGRKSKLSAKATPKVKRGFEGTTSKKLNQVIRRVRSQNREYNEKLTDLETAQMNAMELMANMLGGYLIIDHDEGAIYISNDEDLDSATEYWKWGLGGFIHYKDGVIDTGITADGSIVAYLVSAGIVTADMVKTGILQSQDGNTWINLNNGHFSLGDIVFDDDGFRMTVGGKTLKDSLAELEVEIGMLVDRVEETEFKVEPDRIVSTVTGSDVYMNDLGEKVTKDRVISEINQSSEQIQINANRLKIGTGTTFEEGEIYTWERYRGMTWEELNENG